MKFYVVKILTKAARALLPRQTYGALRYRLTPHLGVGWGGPFNGQAKRCHLFSLLIHELTPASVVETGTYLGTTTEWIAAFNIPTYSCEASPENYGFSKSRLQKYSNVNIMQLDSRKALAQLFRGELKYLTDKPILFYLDAHWEKDLPLAEELELIFSNCRNAVVLIDDFQVIDDLGYGFDNYGPGKSLTLNYIGRQIESHKLSVYFPITPSQKETGAKRGCVVLADDQLMGPVVDRVPLLRRYTAFQ
jgi:hypothetical protein